MSGKTGSQREDGQEDMTSQQPGNGGWAWLGRDSRDLLGCLVFARDITPEQVIEGYGMDPATAQMLPLDLVDEEEFLFPVFADDGYTTVNPWIRAGKLGDWAFATNETGGDRVGYHQEAAQRISAGTEAVVVIWTSTIDSLYYYADGTLMMGVADVGMPWYRGGSDPDRFVTEMRRVGLQVERPDPDEQQARNLDERTRILEAQREGREIEIFDPLVATLEMLTLALGIQLPEEVAWGPLLTVQSAPTDSHDDG